AMGISDEIHAHFQKNTYWGGLTYNSHPFCLRVGEAVVRTMLEENMVENAARLESVMKAEMAALKEKHPSFGAGRALGLFGIVEVRKNSKGEPMAPYNGNSEAMQKLAK